MARILSLSPSTASRPTQNSKNAPDAQNSTTRECRTEEQSGGVAQSNRIKRHPAICLSKESTEGGFAEKMHFSSPASGLRNASSVERCRGFALKQGSVASASEESRNYVDQPILAVNSTLGALRALHLICCAHMRLLTVTAERFVEGLPQFSPSSKLGPQLCRRKPRFDCSHYCILRSAPSP